MKLDKTVNNVLNNVLNVKLLPLTVLSVTQPEKKLQNVNVHMVNMLTITKKSVKIVNIIVKLVTTKLTIVKSVKETESMLQNVPVNTVISKLSPLNVQNVHTNVTLVKEPKKTVFLVPKTEFILHFVPAH